MGDGISSYLFTQGVLGIACLVLGIVCIKLYGKTERQQARIDQLQELRLADSKEVTKEITEVVQGNSQALALMGSKIEVVQQKGQN